MDASSSQAKPNTKLLNSGIGLAFAKEQHLQNFGHSRDLGVGAGDAGRVSPSEQVAYDFHQNFQT